MPWHFQHKAPEAGPDAHMNPQADCGQPAQHSNLIGNTLLDSTVFAAAHVAPPDYLRSKWAPLFGYAVLAAGCLLAGQHNMQTRYIDESQGDGGKPSCCCCCLACWWDAERLVHAREFATL